MARINAVPSLSLRLCLALVIGWCALLAVAAPAAAQIDWRGAPPTDLQMSHDQLAAVAADLSAEPQRSHVVIQFSDPVSKDRRRALAESGVALQGYLGDHAYFAMIEPAAFDAAALLDTENLRLLAQPEAAQKLHPAFTTGEIGEWAVDATSDPNDPTVAAYVLFHRDVELGSEGFATARRYGADVRSRIDAVNGLVLRLRLSDLHALAAEDAVQWIEQPLPAMGEVNNSNRNRTQAAVAHIAPYNLSGAGVSVLVYDGGYGLASHQDFGGRLTVRDNSGLSNHSTHVAGTIGGSGAASGGNYRGMAPAVTLESYGLDVDGGGTFLYTNPGDVEGNYWEAINIYGVDIANNSIGTNTETNGFPCEIQGDYGITDALIDSIVRGALGTPFRIVWAAGNERQGSRCDVEGYGDYYSTAPPATAKNHITVGALNSNDDSMTSFSSWGPTDDGRLKPDIAGPGCQSNDDDGVTSTSSSGGYTTMCGTSMASPTVCGLAALVLEDYRDQFPFLADLRNSTLKILFAHTAVDLGQVGPDYQFGYGSVRVVDAIDHMRTGQFFEGMVDQGGMVAFSVDVPVGAPELKITAAWDDMPGTPNVATALVNDLDLVVFSPSQTRAYPWTLNPLGPVRRGGPQSGRSPKQHRTGTRE